jgi:hypothetical protein
MGVNGVNVNVYDYLDDIIDFFDEDEQGKLHDLFDAIQFKLNRNFYHIDNIKNIVLKAKGIETERFYDSVYYPIYYEMEGFLVSLRSSVDILLHMLNFCFKFDLKGNEVTLYNVYHHPELPKNVKNIFDRYTRPYKNPTWNFIYTFRNETVHERSINQVLPIQIDLFTDAHSLVFFELENQEKEMMDFFNQCMRHLDNFTTQLFNAVKISL